jgi:toxin YoeB
MKIEISNQFKEDIEALRKIDIKLTYKVWELIFSILNNFYEGIGKPEPLRHNLSGCWSRRITQEHRLIYKIENNTLLLLSCYGHYE